MDPLRQLTETLRDRYDVEREVGAGGMATVYRARDLRHERLVALKVLRPELGAVLGAERFLAEIRVTANLQHPNILPLFDSGEAEGLLYYVMPFVDGETLRARLDRERQLPIEEAIAITRAIANALDYAHASNVIHRDLKPENILFQAGQPVLADFGIALAVANAGGTRVTQTGLSLGTPQYMSPEQATGDRVIDGRTDLYSLAAVLYEMLSGEPPHIGNTAQAIIARVLTDKPRSVRSTRDTIPPHIDAALERGLAKLAADRFATGREFVNALGAGFVTTSAGVAAQPPQDIRVSFSISRAAVVRAAKWTAIAAAIAIGAWGWLRTPEGVRTQHIQFIVEPPDSIVPAAALGQESLVISPDGSEFVYPAQSAGSGLFRRRFDALTFARVAESELAQNPRYSPDGQWIALEMSGGRLMRFPLFGGPAIRITDSASRATWAEGGTIVFGRARGLWRVSDAGGPATRLTTPDTAAGETNHSFPFALPGGKAALFAIAGNGSSVDDDEIAVVNLSDGRITKLGVHGTNPRYVRSGHLLFAHQDGTISAVAFDPSRHKRTGEPVTVLDGVLVKSGGVGMYSVSNNGTLIFIRGSSAYHIAEANAQGKATTLTALPGKYERPRISPRGDQLVFSTTEAGGSDVWTFTRGTGQLFRLTRDGKSRGPEWMPDGRRIAWLHQDSARTTIRIQSADGSGTPRTVTPADGNILDFTIASRGDMAAIIGGVSGSRRISVMALDTRDSSRVLISTGSSALGPHFSPDGRWIAYFTPEPGRNEVFIANVENPSTRIQVSTNGGIEPAWSPDGRALTYRDGQSFVKASLAFAPRVEVTKREVLFPVGIYQGGVSARGYDVNPKNGNLIVRMRNVAEREHITVVTGWLDELRERMAGAGRR